MTSSESSIIRHWRYSIKISVSAEGTGFTCPTNSGSSPGKERGESTENADGSTGRKQLFGLLHILNRTIAPAPPEALQRSLRRPSRVTALPPQQVRAAEQQQRPAHAERVLRRGMRRGREPCGAQRSTAVPLKQMGLCGQLECLAAEGRIDILGSSSYQQSCRLGRSL
mmetsp:Transcript_130937/g.419194  ORF Transcript_130937/g.419194 Transcript_130937/m.419194 type:complete len:168 (+) Transcript_130937:132-635(+)